MRNRKLNSIPAVSRSERLISVLGHSRICIVFALQRFSGVVFAKFLCPSNRHLQAVMRSDGDC